MSNEDQFLTRHKPWLVHKTDLRRLNRARGYSWGNSPSAGLRCATLYNSSVGRTIEKCSWFDRTHICDIVVGFCKAGCRHAAVLFIRQRNSLPNLLVDELRDQIIAHAEVKDFRHRTRNVGHCQLSLPRVT